MKHLVAGAAFLVGVLCGCLALRHFFPATLDVYIQDRLEQFIQRQDAYDTLFIGSSRIRHQIDPALFDELNARQGHPTHSFNFGLDGMFPPEDEYVCEQIFRGRALRLRQVFLEADAFLPALHAAETDTSRGVEWHNGPRMFFVARSLWLAYRGLNRPDALPLATVWPIFQEHLSGFARYSINLGQGASRAASLLDPFLVEWRDRPAWRERVGNGYDPLETPVDEGEIDLYRKALAKRPEKPVATPFDEPGEENLKTIEGMIRASGARPILLLPPRPEPRQSFPAPSPEVPLIDASNLARWPELYRVENRHDYGHLNPHGAELYTRMVATEWHAIVMDGR